MMALHPSDLTQQEREICDLIRPDFDPSCCLPTNQDVCDAALDPLHHYVRSGRLEGRRPAHWFDPAHYRAFYREVDDSGDDPFSNRLHFGRARSIILMHPSTLLHELRSQLSSTRGLIVAVSHDRYLPPSPRQPASSIASAGT